jgi:hypothetical protein
VTRPAYDPLRPPAPRFPEHRFRAAGLPDEAVQRIAAEYEGMDYDARVRFFKDATRVPNEELSRRYADGTDAGPSPAMLTAEQIADQVHLNDLRSAAKAADVSAGGTKVEIAARLVDAGKTGDLPIVTPEQVTADQQTPAEPASAPPVAPEAPAAPSAPEAPAAPATEPVTAPPAPEVPAAPGSASPQVAPATPAAPATGTPSTGGTTP